MKTILLRLWHWLANRAPEVMLGLFLLALVPLAVLGATQTAVRLAQIVANPAQFGVTLLNDPWPTVAGVICLLGLPLLVRMLIGHRQVIWAVARKIIVESLHRRAILMLLVLFMALIPMLPFVLEAEGSLKSHVQLVLLYSLSLALVLLSLVAIVVSASSICAEVERRYVHITDTKPARRWEFLVGKWLGVFVMCTVVLFVMAGACYVLVQLVATRTVYGVRAGAGDPAERARRGDGASETTVMHATDYNPVREEVFVARRSVKAKFDEDAIAAYVEPIVDKWVAEGNLRTRAVHGKRQTLRQQYLWNVQRVPPTGSIVWEFGGLDKDLPVTVRFKAVALGSRSIFGAWYACDKVLLKGETKDQAARFSYRRRKGTAQNPIPVVVAPKGGWPSRSPCEFPLPPGAVGDDGFLYLRYENRDARAQIGASVNFDAEELIEVMQRQGGFLPNYYRSLIIVAAHIGLLAALGLMAGSLFSFPVATLMVVFFFVGGMVAPWFHEQFVKPNIFARLSVFGEVVDSVWRGFAGTIVAALPNFGRYNPLDLLVHGKLVGWGLVSMAGAWLFFVKGGIALLIAAYFYTRRELARVIV